MTPDRLVSVSQRDWDLHRKGPIDEARHQKKIVDAIKENLDKIVSDEPIITSDGKTIIKVPVRSLNVPTFRYGEGLGMGQGSGNAKKGDVLGNVPQSGNGQKAGGEPGVDYYEVGITIDHFSDILFENCKLPYLRPKQDEIEIEKIQYTDVRRKGPMSNLDIRRTILQNIKRNAMNGRPHFGGISNDDLRFRTWTQEIRRESNAVVIAMRDVSGSMGEFQKFISRTSYFWMTRFLRNNYQNVQIAFLTHHTEAKEVDEQTFFNLGEGGGTKVSSVYELAQKIIRERFSPERWNIYPFHFSDGDNWGDPDNNRCVQIINEMLTYCNMFGYGEIKEGNNSNSVLMNAYNQGINDPHFVAYTFRSKEDIRSAMERFFPKKVAQGVA